MRWRLFRGGFLLRTLVQELRGIHQQLARQNDTLERLIAIYAPTALPSSLPAAGDLSGTGVSYLDAAETALVLDYASKVMRDTGRAPTEEEILSYLADEKTQSLQQRLKDRAAAADGAI